MSDFTTLGVQQYAQECYDLRKENKQLRAEVERLQAIIVELRYEVKARGDDAHDEVERLKAELDALTNWHNALLAACYGDGIDVEAIKRLLSTEGEEE